jgi:hypothetical protein
VHFSRRVAEVAERGKTKSKKGFISQSRKVAKESKSASHFLAEAQGSQRETRLRDETGIVFRTYLKIADYEQCRHTRESGYPEKTEKTGFPFSRE